MANLKTKIKKYCEDNEVNSVNFLSDVLIQDDMIDGVSSPYIHTWNFRHK